MSDQITYFYSNRFSESHSTFGLTPVPKVIQPKRTLVSQTGANAADALKPSCGDESYPYRILQAWRPNVLNVRG